MDLAKELRILAVSILAILMKFVASVIEGTSLDWITVECDCLIGVEGYTPWYVGYMGEMLE